MRTLNLKTLPAQTARVLRTSNVLLDGQPQALLCKGPP